MWSFRATRLAAASGADEVPHCSLLFSGAGGSGGGTLLATRTIENTGGGATATNSHTPAFGLHFKQGDIPSGTYPLLKTTGGTTVPYSFWGESRGWPDGSLKFIGVLPRFPDAISGSSTADLKVVQGGTAPSASSRTVSEVYAASIEMAGLTGLDNITGDWIAALQSANIAETVVIGDGPAGKVWRFLVEYKQSGSAHGQLRCYFYVMALQDGSGNLAGFRVLARTTQPFYDVDSPTKDYRSFTSLVLRHGAGPTTIDPMASYSAKTFTWANSGVSNSLLTVTGHGFNNGVAFRATSTGTLPTGIATGTTYWALVIDANTLYLMNSPAIGKSFDGVTLRTVSGAGSGTHTLTPVPYVCHFCSYLTATTEGKYQYIQGGGSVATEPTLRVKADIAYDHTTRMLPPYDLSVSSVVSNSSYNWAPYQVAELAIAINGTGERPDIGVMPSFTVRHYLTQAAVDERYARIVGMAAGQFGICMRNSTSKSLLNLSGNSYTGMPASQATYQYRCTNGAVSGFTAPITHGSEAAGMFWTQCFSGVDATHMPQLAGYAYLAFAEPHYYDFCKEMANALLLFSPAAERNVTVSAVNYKGIAIAGEDGIRGGAWKYCSLLSCAMLSPDTDWDGNAHTTYIRDLVALQATYQVAYIATLSSWAQTSGFWMQQDCAANRASWMIGYLWQTTLWHAAGMADSNALAAATHFSKWPPYIVTLTGSTFMLGTYYERTSTTNPPSANAFISSDAEWAALANNTATMSWATAGDLFTLTSPNFTPANDDKWQFADPNGTSTSKPGAAFSFITSYYAVNRSGNTFQLSNSVGGAAKTVGANGSAPTTEFVMVLPKNSPSTGYIGGSVSESGYGSNQSMCCDWAIALGITTTGLSGAASNLRTRNAGVSYANDMKYRAQQSY